MSTDESLLHAIERAAMTQRLLFDLPAPLPPPLDLAEHTCLLPSDAAERHLVRDSWPIPARCPVTGGPTCHP